MSSSSEKLFGQDKNLIIAVASTIIFVCAVAMLGVFINNGVSTGWSGTTIMATIFSSVIAFVFVSIAVTYGFIKGKEYGGQALADVAAIRAKDKKLNDDLAKASIEAAAKVRAAAVAAQLAKEQKGKATAAVVGVADANKIAAITQKVAADAGVKVAVAQQKVAAAVEAKK